MESFSTRVGVERPIFCPLIMEHSRREFTGTIAIHHLYSLGLGYCICINQILRYFASPRGFNFIVFSLYLICTLNINAFGDKMQNDQVMFWNRFEH